MCKVFCCNPVVRNGNKETTDALIRAMRDEALKPDIEKYDFLNGDGFTYYGLHIRETRRKCVLVLFSSSKAMRMNVICHEASHACDAIEGNIEMKHGGEPSAYLIGWIASCINKARLGIGDFVEIVDKEEK